MVCLTNNLHLSWFCLVFLLFYLEVISSCVLLSLSTSCSPACSVFPSCVPVHLPSLTPASQLSHNSLSVRLLLSCVFSPVLTCSLRASWFGLHFFFFFFFFFIFWILFVAKRFCCLFVLITFEMIGLCYQLFVVEPVCLCFCVWVLFYMTMLF